MQSLSIYPSQKLNQQICISPEPRCSSKLTHTGVFELNTCALQTACQLSSAASVTPLGLCFLAQFPWYEMNIWNNWQLAVLPQSGGTEFDPHSVHDNLSVPLSVICISLCQSIKIKPTIMYMFTFLRTHFGLAMLHGDRSGSSLAQIMAALS